MDTSNFDIYLKDSLVRTVFDIDDDHIKAVERLIRTSNEYKVYIADKRLNENKNRDILLPDYDFSDTKKAKLNLHHDITLYDLCSTAYNYLVQTTNSYISTFMVADLVMQWHYEDIVPYVFLSETAHGLYHDGKYEYPLDKVCGNYTILNQLYRPYFTNAALTEMDKLLEVHKDA